MKKPLLFTLIFIFSLLSSCIVKVDRINRFTINLGNFFSISPYVIIECNESFYNTYREDIYNSLREILSDLDNKYKDYDIITDIGSGINYTKKGILSLIDKINKKEVDVIVVLYKDRLLRFGFELVEYFARINNVKIEALDKINKTEDKELVEDLIQIITVFSCRLQGRRKSKTKEILDEFYKKMQEISNN